MPLDRWPRAHYPVLPALLRRSWAAELPPPVISNASGLLRIRYSDLDDTIHLNPNRARPLADHLIRRIRLLATRRPHDPILDQRLLTHPWPRGVHPATIPFSPRTSRVTPNYSGPVTLFDFATAVEAQAVVGTINREYPGRGGGGLGKVTGNHLGVWFGLWASGSCSIGSPDRRHWRLGRSPLRYP